jgi:hypothetical protein
MSRRQKRRLGINSQIPGEKERPNGMPSQKALNE